MTEEEKLKDLWEIALVFANKDPRYDISHYMRLKWDMLHAFIAMENSLVSPMNSNTKSLVSSKKHVH